MWPLPFPHVHPPSLVHPPRPRPGRAAGALRAVDEAGAVCAAPAGGGLQGAAGPGLRWAGGLVGGALPVLVTLRRGGVGGPLKCDLPASGSCEGAAKASLRWAALWGEMGDVWGGEGRGLAAGAFPRSCVAGRLPQSLHLGRRVHTHARTQRHVQTITNTHAPPPGLFSRHTDDVLLSEAASTLLHCARSGPAALQVRCEAYGLVWFSLVGVLMIAMPTLAAWNGKRKPHLQPRAETRRAPAPQDPASRVLRAACTATAGKLSAAATAVGRLALQDLADGAPRGATRAQA